jgi:hypothetical protein
MMRCAWDNDDEQQVMMTNDGDAAPAHDGCATVTVLRNCGWATKDGGCMTATVRLRDCCGVTPVRTDERWVTMGNNR